MALLLAGPLGDGMTGALYNVDAGTAPLDRTLLTPPVTLGCRRRTDVRTRSETGPARSVAPGSSTGPAASALPYYTRANAGEVLPDPASPLGWTLVFEEGLLPGWLRGLVEFGIYRADEFEHPDERSAGGRAVRRLLLHQPLALPADRPPDGDDGRGVRRGPARLAPRSPRPTSRTPTMSNAELLGEGRLRLSGRSWVTSSFPQIDEDLARCWASGATDPTSRPCPTPSWSPTPGGSRRSSTTRSPVTTTRRLGSAVGPAMLAEPVRCRR